MARSILSGRRGRSVIVLCWLLSVSFGQACADYAKENPFLLVLLILLGVAFIGVGGFILYVFLMGKKNVHSTQEENVEIQPETAVEEKKAEPTEATEATAGVAEEKEEKPEVLAEEKASDGNEKTEEKAGDEPQA